MSFYVQYDENTLLLCWMFATQTEMSVKCPGLSLLWSDYWYNTNDRKSVTSRYTGITTVRLIMHYIRPRLSLVGIKDRRWEWRDVTDAQLPITNRWTAMKRVSGGIDDNVRVGGKVKVPVANSHVAAGSQNKLVLVTHADVHSVHAVLRRLTSNNTALIQTHRLHNQW